jgi:hypothetical protein
MRPSTPLLRIGIFGAVVEALCLWVLSWIPVGEGTPPETSPVILWMGRIVVLVHFPALLAQGSEWARVAPYAWWVFAFLTGYLEITLAAVAIYWGFALGLRALSLWP